MLRRRVCVYWENKPFCLIYSSFFLVVVNGERSTFGVGWRGRWFIYSRFQTRTPDGRAGSLSEGLYQWAWKKKTFLFCTETTTTNTMGGTEIKKRPNRKRPPKLSTLGVCVCVCIWTRSFWRKTKQWRKRRISSFFLSLTEGDGHHHRVARKVPSIYTHTEDGEREAHSSKNKVHQRIKVSTGTWERRENKPTPPLCFPPLCHSLSLSISKKKKSPKDL